MDKFNVHTGLGKHLFRFFSGMVLPFTEHAFDTAAYDKHGAGSAGSHAAVERGSVKSHTPLGGLTNGVLLGMHGSDAMAPFHTVRMDGCFEQMAHLIAVRQSRRSSHISGSEDLPVFYDNTSAPSSVASRPLSNRVCHLHEIFVPRRPDIGLVHFLFPSLCGALYHGTMEGDLVRAWKRSKKKHGWDNDEDIGADMRETLARCAPVPRSMAEELAAYFFPGPIDEESVYRSEELLEILTGVWAAEASALTDEDWEFLKELVNEWAVEMDMGIVTDIMKVIVERGDFHDN